MKNSNIAKLMALTISFVPSNAARCFLYRMIFGYKIEASRIGFGTMLFVAKLEMRDASVGKFNKFTGPISVCLAEGVVMADRNQVCSGFWLTEEEQNNAIFCVAKGANITSEHYFDVSGGIEIQSGAWIAGRGCQFWTHGAGKRPSGIIIGAESYVGSAVLVSPGVEISQRTTVALGSVVSKSCSQSSVLVGGAPAKVIRQNYFWNEKH